jgi:hypothetical protein
MKEPIEFKITETEEKSLLPITTIDDFKNETDPFTIKEQEKKSILKNRNVLFVIGGTICLVVAVILVAISGLAAYAKNKSYETMIKAQLDNGIKNGSITSYEAVGCHQNFSLKTNCSVANLKTKYVDKDTNESHVLNIESLRIFNMEDASKIPEMIKGTFKVEKGNTPTGKLQLNNITLDGKSLLWNDKNEETLIQTYGDEPSKELREFLKSNFNKPSNIELSYATTIKKDNITGINLTVSGAIGDNYKIAGATNLEFSKEFFDIVKKIDTAKDEEKAMDYKIDLLKNITVNNLALSLKTGEKDFFKNLLYKVYVTNSKSRPEDIIALTTQLAGEKVGSKNKILTEQEFFAEAIPFTKNSLLTSVSDGELFKSLSQEKQNMVKNKLGSFIEGTDSSLTINIVNKKNMNMGEIPQQVMTGFLTKNPNVLTDLFTINFN